MAKLSIREAAKYYQVSRPTLTKALKSGKISGHQDCQGKWSIDPSELARLYQPRPESLETPKPVKETQPVANSATTDTYVEAELEILRAHLAEVEVRALKAEARADAAEILANERAERIEDLRRMLPPPDQTKGRKWWPWR